MSGNPRVPRNPRVRHASQVRVGRQGTLFSTTPVHDAGTCIPGSEKNRLQTAARGELDAELRQLEEDRVILVRHNHERGPRRAQIRRGSACLIVCKSAEFY